MTSIASAISYAAPSPRIRTNKSVIAGRIISGIITALLLADASIKFVTNNPALVEATKQLGYQPSTMPVIGTVLLLCVLLYAIPRTSAFGALLLTGYLGGAVATHVRVGNPLF